ncbi:carbohydrate kinase [Rhodoblastus sp.]|jgi:fructokinase|uniref:carbohydrate kinase family protein n=1 Tax=Rhodoblastus sp. TaxID=1962975 RepID=UPI0025E4DB11|nr:carbohydrate kinase [Rhodoblastus sp.]
MILVCGEALVDLFVDENPDSGLAARVTLGGSPMNVAIGLARLDEKVAFCGGISSDRFGLALRRKLEAERVDLKFVIDSDRLTTISVITTDSSGQPSYSFHGEGKADREVTFSMMPNRLPDEVCALTFGSYTLAVAPVADSYLALAQREAARRVISVDPNLRPTVTPDLAAWKRRFDAFLSLADIVKASEEDIALAYGEEVQIEEVVAGWFAAGATLVLVTHGGNGATGYLKGGEKISVPGKRINVVDTVGAGDTFHAAILSYLNKSGKLTKSGVAGLTAQELGRAIDFAVTAAAITCSRQGADLPRKTEVAAMVSG